MNECAVEAYRAGVGLVLIHDDGTVWAGRRLKSTFEDRYPAGWQWPQGGIERGESLEDALYREMSEEIGTQDFDILCRTENWISYDFPEDLRPQIYQGLYTGQKHIWFAARLASQNSGIHIDTPHPEFAAWQWMSAEALIHHIIPFKKQAYLQVYEHFKHLFKTSSLIYS